MAVESARRRLRGCWLLCCLVAVPAWAGEPLRVAAAADLRGVLDALIAGFQQAQPGEPVEPVFGASGKLSAQIEHGAPFDLLLAADESYPQRLHALGLALAPPQRYARGRLLLWMPGQRELPALPALGQRLRGKLALANPLHAPYGQRAREALQAAGVWEALQDRIVYGENVAQAAQMVASGAAAAGLVGHALVPAGERAVVAIDPALHAPLWQAGVALRRTRQPQRAQALLDFVAGESGQAMLSAAGFGRVADG